MGKIVELYPEPEIPVISDASAAADRKKRREESLEAFLRLQEAIERVQSSAASEALHDLTATCYEFVHSLLAAAPEDVIRDIAYVIILYLKKQAITEGFKVQ
jgi:hypothetical protein